LEADVSLSFSELEAELKEAPATWVPALLRALVWRAVKVNVFRKGGLLEFVRNVLTDVGSA
jgi:hypothetical protein